MGKKTHRKSKSKSTPKLTSPRKKSSGPQEVKSLPQSTASDAYMVQAKHFLTETKLSAARDACVKALELDPSLDVIDTCAEILMEVGDYDLAVAAFERGLAMDSTSIAAAHRLLSMSEITNNPVQIQTALSILVAIPTPEAKELSQLALCALAETLAPTDVPHALEAARGAHSLSPTLQASVTLAAILAQQEEDAAKIEAATLATEAFQLLVAAGLIQEDAEGEVVLSPSAGTGVLPPPGCLLQLSELLGSAGKVEEAEACARLVLAADERDVAGLHQLGWVLNLANRFEEACVELDKALTLVTGVPGMESVAEDLRSKILALKSQ